MKKRIKKRNYKKTYQINEYAAKLCGNRKSLKTFSKKASGSGNVNLLIPGVSGGVYDAVYMKKVVKYAELKYRRRFYEKQGKTE